MSCKFNGNLRSTATRSQKNENPLAAAPPPILPSHIPSTVHPLQLYSPTLKCYSIPPPSVTASFPQLLKQLHFPTLPDSFIPHLTRQLHSPPPSTTRTLSALCHSIPLLPRQPEPTDPCGPKFIKPNQVLFTLNEFREKSFHTY